MKYFFSCWLLVWASFTGLSQDLSLWSQDTIVMANTAADVHYLTAEEKKVIQLINLARIDGRAFIDRVAKPYARQNELDDDEYLETMFEDLRNTSGLSLLKPLEKLWESAAYHAHDMGHKGLFGHQSSDGTDLFDRMHRFHKRTHMAESLCYGYGEAYDIVMQLLLDEAVELKSNRHNILSEDFHHLGVSIKPHKVYEFNCVIDFSGF